MEAIRRSRSDKTNLTSIAKRDQRWRGDNDIGRFGLADEGNALIFLF